MKTWHALQLPMQKQYAPPAFSRTLSFAPSFCAVSSDHVKGSLSLPRLAWMFDLEGTIPLKSRKTIGEACLHPGFAPPVDPSVRHGNGPQPQAWPPLKRYRMPWKPSELPQKHECSPSLGEDKWSRPSSIVKRWDIFHDTSLFACCRYHVSHLNDGE